MASDSRQDNESDAAGSDDDPFVHRPFQFTLRTMLLLTLVVALFCSAAITFEGMSRILAFSALLWLVVGAACCRMRAAATTDIAYIAGPVYGVVLWAGSAYRGSVWQQEWRRLFAVGFFAGSVLTVSLVCLRRRW
jgi:hypothetical protein